MSFTRPHRATLSLPPPSSSPFPCLLTPPTHLQIRRATLLRRPKRPYTFTQLVVLSDGSTFTHRTTSPVPVYKSQKDSRNTLLWNPSSRKTLGAQSDEAGKLKAFRDKYGPAWRVSDAEEMEGSGSEQTGQDQARVEESGGEDGFESAAPGENLMDMIGEYGKSAAIKGQALGAREAKKKSGKGKGGQK